MGWATNPPGEVQRWCAKLGLTDNEATCLYRYLGRLRHFDVSGFRHACTPEVEAALVKRGLLQVQDGWTTITHDGTILVSHPTGWKILKAKGV